MGDDVGTFRDGIFEGCENIPDRFSEEEGIRCRDAMYFDDIIRDGPVVGWMMKDACEISSRFSSRIIHASCTRRG